ncbi:MAG: hypothetical protein BGO49_10380 [Planctomycetales bacterium 71-10]|nr:MAG: hypothetical protein BGO49_10380 [Planctomycetales bacterium 71-10]
MSRKHDQRAPRRATSPTLATLEERRLMTRGVMPTPEPAPFIVPKSAPAFATTVAASDARLAGSAGIVAATTLPAYDAASTKDWIYSGSDAQFGPAGLYVLSGGNAWPTPSSPSSDASTPQGKLDAAFAKQSADIQAIQDRSEVTPRLLASLRAAREKAASEAGTADAALVKALQDGADAVQKSGTFTDAQRAQLRADYTAALKGAGVSDAAIAGLFAAQDAVLAAGHVTADDLKTLADDQAAVQALLDAMPRDAVAYTTDIAASARGPAALGGTATAYATTASTTAATSTPAATTTAATTAASAAAKSAATTAAIGALPQSVQAPGRDTPAATTTTTPVAMRPSGFESSIQVARLSRRMSNATTGRVRNAIGNRALVPNAQAVPAVAGRRLQGFQGMRTASRP